MSADLRKAIEWAYTRMGTYTPLAADCGQLCDSACCRGDKDAGMLLFPGEAALLRDVPGFHIRRIPYLDGRAWLLTCAGTCKRENRPLSCRIFPLAPHVGRNGCVTALPDPRARGICPLADGESLHPRFRWAVSRTLSGLADNPKMLAYMSRVSGELEELRRFYR